MDLTGLIRKESLETIKEVLSTTEIPVDHQWLDYEVLNTALEYERKDVADFLLKGNCRVNKTTILSFPLNTPLHNAVKIGDVQLVAELLSRGASITVCNMESNTPLHLAFILSHEGIIDLILDAIAQNKDFSNVKNKYGLSHMHIACTRKNSEVIQGYLGTVANIKDTVHVDSMLWPGFTPLHFAAKFKSVEALKVLMKHSSKQDCTKQDAKGRTALQIVNANLEEDYLLSDHLSVESPNILTSSYKTLSHFHMACTKNDPEAVRRLLEKGAPIDTPMSADATICPGFTPLHFAVTSNAEKTVELLLRQGADINRVTAQNETPLHLALYKNNPNGKSKKYIIDLLYACVKDKLDDREDENGLSYFHVACTRNDVDTVRKYLDMGKDLNGDVCSKTPFDGYSPLHFAVLYNCLEVAELLIERGAKVNVLDEGRDGTPLHMAFFFGHKDMANLLLKNGADATALRSDVDQSTTLHLLVGRCVHKGDDEMLPFVKRLVFEFGVDVNAKDSKGNTALHLACKKFKTGVACIEILLEAGADVNLENLKGEVAFELAMSASNQDGKNLVDYTILYDHVQNLRALNFEVNAKNEKCCELVNKMKRQVCNDEKKHKDIKDVAEKHQKRLVEVKKLKKHKIVDGMTLYELLKMEPKEAATHLTNENLRNLFGSSEFQDCFLTYKYFIRLLANLCDANAKSADDAEPVIKRPRSE